MSANPFDPSAVHVPEPLARLFAAIDDIQREYHAGSREAIHSLGDACRRADHIIREILYMERPLPAPRDSLIPGLTEVGV